MRSRGGRRRRRGGHRRHRPRAGKGGSRCAWNDDLLTCSNGGGRAEVVCGHKGRGRHMVALCDPVDRVARTNRDGDSTARPPVRARRCLVRGPRNGARVWPLRIIRSPRRIVRPSGRIIWRPRRRVLDALRGVVRCWVFGPSRRIVRAYSPRGISRRGILRGPWRIRGIVGRPRGIAGSRRPIWRPVWSPVLGPILRPHPRRVPWPWTIIARCPGRARGRHRLPP
jgi:hypothetical protein